MNLDHAPREPRSRSHSGRTPPLVSLIGGLTLLLWMAPHREAAAQDLLSVLAQSGVRAGYGHMDPHCFIERQARLAISLSHAARTPPPPSVEPRYRSLPPARGMNVQVYPPPAPPRSMDARVWPEPPAARRSVDVRVMPEPVRKPVGTWTGGGYVLNGSIPAWQRVSPEPPRYDPRVDRSPTQEQLRAR